MSLTEFGIFNDEGLVEGEFYSEDDAREAIAAHYSEDEWAKVEEVCPEHREQPALGCEECDR